MMTKWTFALFTLGAVGSVGWRNPTHAAENQAKQEERGNQGAARPLPAQVMATVVEATGTVEEVDRRNRRLVVKDPDGNRIMVQVPKDVAGLEGLKKGDPVQLTHHQEIATALVPRAGAAPAMEERVVGRRLLGGETVAREVTAVMTIDAVDTSKNSVTFKAPDGRSHTVKVEDPQLRSDLKNIKPGDAMAVTYTEAVATRIAATGQKTSRPGK